MKLLVTLALASLLLLKVAEAVNYDVACSDASECDAAANMKCETKCVCTDATFGPKDDKTGCLLILDQACTANDQCLTNKCTSGKCVGNAHGDACDADKTCIANANFNCDTTCQCTNDTYVVNAAKDKCLLKAGQPCTENALCLSNKCEGATDSKTCSGAAVITGSLILMAVTLVTSRFL
ncbi:uncharacterized protein LOC143301648 isoform X2 [Babylonia areolata]|uniref:uncharacterized protein LOC143301648 isoform X2 n=1 Tax=Babylonia areolata TaxID=304850 RepID=UPI003FD1032F